MKNILIILLIFILGISILSPSFCQPEKKEVIIATTTSICDTGLMDLLAGVFQKKTGYILKPIAVGTGEALTMGGRGEADVVMVHNEQAEKEFMQKGYGIKRERIMHNFFVVVGPQDDPANVKTSKSVFEAFKKINNHIFVSRGDKSGTNMKELAIWNKVGIKPEGKWYLETGQSMAQTLLIANDKGAYSLSDIGTFLTLKSKLQLVILFEKDSNLINIYSAIEVNPEKFPSVNKDGARAFINFLISSEAQNLIKTFGEKEYGKPLFIPDRL